MNLQAFVTEPVLRFVLGVVLFGGSLYLLLALVSIFVPASLDLPESPVVGEDA